MSRWVTSETGNISKFITRNHVRDWGQQFATAYLIFARGRCPWLHASIYLREFFTGGNSQELGS